jgi:hypothetical protein
MEVPEGKLDRFFIDLGIIDDGYLISVYHTTSKTDIMVSWSPEVKQRIWMGTYRPIYNRVK